MARLALALVCACALATPAFAGFLTYEDIQQFNAAAGMMDQVLFFRTDKAGTETFTAGQWKVRPGSYFSDLVTFSSPTTPTPNSVWWGHFDGPDGGIGSWSTLLPPLRLDFTAPVSATGFRLRGIQPGTNVRYYGSDGLLIGEVVATPSSFIGAISDIPIAYLVVQENPPLPTAGQWQQPAYITMLHIQVATVPAPPAWMLILSAMMAVLPWQWRRWRG